MYPKLVSVVLIYLAVMWYVHVELSDLLIKLISTNRVGVGIWGIVPPNCILANTAVQQLESKFNIGTLVSVKVTG